MTKDLNALRLLDKDERLLIVASLREHMSNFEGNLVLKSLDLANKSSPINQSHRSRLLDTDPALTPTEFSHLEDADLEDLFHENALSVGTTAAAPQDIDLMYVAPVISSHENKDPHSRFASQYSAGTEEEPEFHHVGQLSPSFGVINQSDRYDLSDRLAIPDIELPEDYQEGEKWQGLASSLTDLYMDYRRGIAKGEVIPSAVMSATPPVVDSQELVDPTDVQTEPAAISSLVHATSRVSLGSTSVDPADTQVAHAAMSKTQYQLTVEEGKLWEKLTDPEGAFDHDESPTETILASLREKSCFMAQSLVRRSNPPTEVTYEESKSVLHAMGVPCIDSTGPYEAEALASSLVLNGYADYVASEDTVCWRTQILAFILSFAHQAFLHRTCWSMGHLFSATSQAKTNPSCSCQALRCGLRSVSTPRPSLTLPSSSGRISHRGFGTLAHGERYNIFASTAR